MTTVIPSHKVMSLRAPEFPPPSSIHKYELSVAGGIKDNLIDGLLFLGVQPWRVKHTGGATVEVGGKKIVQGNRAVAAKGRGVAVVVE